MTKQELSDEMRKQRARCDRYCDTHAVILDHYEDMHKNEMYLELKARK